MKPKPFWPLNHFTTPVAILLSKGANSANRPHDLRAGSNSISTMSRGRRLRPRSTSSAFKSNALDIQHSPAIARARSEIPSTSAFFRSSLMKIGTDREAPMAHQDRYGLTLSTASTEAAEAYRDGVDLLLAAWPGAAEAFERAIAADPEFALPHIARARIHTFYQQGDVARKKAAL